jgi:hypothetical protein
MSQPTYLIVCDVDLLDHVEGNMRLYLEKLWKLWQKFLKWFRESTIRSTTNPTPDASLGMVGGGGFRLHRGGARAVSECAML